MSILKTVAAVAAAVTISFTAAKAADKDIVDTAVSAGSFETLVAAVRAAELVDTLKGEGPFTVFAPTDDAFAKLPAGTVEDLLKPENKDKLVAVLTYHVVPGKVMSSDIAGKELSAATVQGGEVMRSLAVIAATLLASLPVQAEEMDTAILQGLDKVTARVSTFEVPVGRSAIFGTLEIIPRTCDKRPPEETPESAAFLDIWEVRRGDAAQSLFRGWMFASSPALNALEHPVYDVWVLDCKNAPVVDMPGDESLPDPSPVVAE